MPTLTELDRRHVWHPYTQHAVERDPMVISRAKGAVMYDADGHEILDLICSWWTCLHGHSHSELNRALADQAEKAPHVMFAGFTHEPGVRLAEKLAVLLPGDLNRVFFSDNGSTAVEVALKTAYQYWANRGEPERRTFVAFEGGYHGDTLGAMSVGKGSGFFNLYEEIMCSVIPTPYAGTWLNDQNCEAREEKALAALENVLAVNTGKLAAIILEPLMQGAAGMVFCRPEFIRKVADMAAAFDVLVIFDEVATGFGRTGSMFACQQCDVTPDIVCLSKGLTAGYMPMSVTIMRDKIFNNFLGDGFDRALAHGHSFTGNPLACAVALRSLDLFSEENTLDRIGEINQLHHEFSTSLQESPHLKRTRVLGSILACDFDGEDGYKSTKSVAFRDWFLSRGFNIRPIGSTLYIMPPYCITDEQLRHAYDILLQGVGEVMRDA